MTDSFLRLIKEGNIAVLEFVAKSKNANHMVLLSNKLAQLCHEADADPDVKIIVLAGVHEDSFVMGEELIEAVAKLDETAWEQVHLADKFISNIKKPVIAAIRGDAIGMGLEMMMACDIRMTSNISCFGLPHVKKGFTPWGGGSQRLPRLVGPGKAMEMMLTGCQIDAKEAYLIGLVNTVVENEDVIEAAIKVARNMSNMGTVGLQYAKEAVIKGMDLTLEQGMRLEADLYFLLQTTSDRTEGIRAFQENRPARFNDKDDDL